MWFVSIPEPLLLQLQSYTLPGVQHAYISLYPDKLPTRIRRGTHHIVLVGLCAPELHPAATAERKRERERLDVSCRRCNSWYRISYIATTMSCIFLRYVGCCSGTCPPCSYCHFLFTCMFSLSTCFSHSVPGFLQDYLSLFHNL